MTALETPVLIRAMHDAQDKGLQGGIARVHVLTSPLTAEFSHDHLSRVARDDTVTSMFVAGGHGVYSAEAYSPDGQRILFCGHGALAAAFVVCTTEEPGRDEVAFASANRSWRARRAGGERFTLAYRRPVVRQVDVPAFTSRCVGQRAQAAAEAGGENDYLILEMPDADSVKAARPDVEVIRAATRRALIVTAAHDFDGEAGCVFRYFAPQYGAEEDAATGSAAVQLAAYWHERAKHGALFMRQLSAGGAAMQTTCNDRVVELTARVGYGDL